MTIKDFSRAQIKKIAEKYAKEDISRSYFMEKYNITSSVFYRILEKAIVEHIVSLNTVEKMRQRAIKNVKIKMHDNTLGNKSRLHYDNLLFKRRNFLFSKKQRILIITDLVNSNFDVTNLCENRVISLYLLQKIILYSIAHQELPKEIIDSIKNEWMENSTDPNKILVVFSVLQDETSKKLNSNVLYKRIYNILISENDDNEVEVKITKTNENAEIIDDGYTIIDED